MEVSFRPLSDRWIYDRHWRNWQRRSRSHSRSRCYSDDYGSEGGQHQRLSCRSSTSTNGSSLLVSELKGSLTDLTRGVKTYSFIPSEDDLPPIVVEPPDSSPASSSSPKPCHTPKLLPGLNKGKVGQSFQSIDSGADSESFVDVDEDIDPFSIREDNFVTGLCSVFDRSLKKLRSPDRSHSLPNVFSALEHEHTTIDTGCISTTTDTSTSASIGSIMEGSSVAIDGPEFTTHPSPERRNPRPASFEEDTIIPRRFGLSPSRTSSATVFPVFPGPAHSPPSNGASASGGYESGPDGVRELSYLNGKGRHTLHGSLIGHAPNPNQRRRTFNLGSSSTETVEPVVLRKKRKKERHW